MPSPFNAMLSNTELRSAVEEEVPRVVLTLPEELITVGTGGPPPPPPLLSGVPSAPPVLVGGPLYPSAPSVLSIQFSWGSMRPICTMGSSSTPLPLLCSFGPFAAHSARSSLVDPLWVLMEALWVLILHPPGALPPA
ncbi:unnamed protein product [Cyclocybe aegerita]|uniref:Uncharacterized protein n=1 Tax=Cyclocybe aegerita TaxID=1973307 RepID=A0A8S0VVJ0_CYCAE|nr:unnamed protein product [Cyclocybe aegerita]